MREAGRSSVALALLVIALGAFAEDFRSWIDSPEALFASEEERNAWFKVGSPADAERFIDDYWRKRGERMKSEVRTRIEKADQMFSYGNVRGSRTARGRVWIILGSPNRQQTIRSNTIEAGIPGQFQNNPMERGAIMTTRWVYQRDRLPRELGVPELTVSFQTDTARGYQVIENPGLVEPYLKRAVAHFSSKQSLAVSAKEEAVMAAPARRDDPLWHAAENLGGTSFTGEAFVSVGQQPFYAVSFYIPKALEAFAPLKSVLFVALVKDESGQPVVTIRDQMPLQSYGRGGDRYLDRAFPLAPGKYSGAFAIFTPEGSTMLSNHSGRIDIPQPSDSRISTLLPTSAIETREKQDVYDPFTFVATKYAVKGDRRFSVSEPVGFFAVIENPAGEPEPSLTMSMTVLKDGTLLDRTAPAPAALTRTGPHSWLIGPLFEAGTFKPGRYAIELFIRDLKAPKESEAFRKGMSTRAEFEIVQ